MFKKTISILAACAMFATMAMPVFAAEAGEADKATFNASFEFKGPDALTSKIEPFTANGKEYTDTYLNRVPENSKFTLTALVDGIYMETMFMMEGQEYGYGLAPSGVFGPIGAEDGMKKGESITFTMKGSPEVQVFTVYSMKQDVSQRFYYMTGAGAPATTPPAKGDTAAPETAAPISFEDGTAYTVKAGDTLGLLSLNNYGSYNYWDELYTANAAVLKKSGGKIYKDLVINIPTTIAKGVTAVSPATAGEGEKLYTAQSGDTLGTIALATYKDMSKYKAIFERNSDRLANVNTIYAGQVIVLPVA